MTGPFSPEVRSYGRGYEDAQRADRIAAFGAIRRAARYARYCDGEAANVARTPGRTGDEIRFAGLTAVAVRLSIRAAIGSEKA